MLHPRAIPILATVHADLQRVIVRAADFYAGHFTITEGERTAKKQAAMVASGASKTLKGRHVAACNQCGVACAVDLAEWLDIDGDGSIDNGEIRWDGPLYFDLAYAVQRAARMLQVDVVWGGCWSSLLTTDNLEDAQLAYAQRKRAQGERPLIDGPHFELSRSVYP
jgi:peptidoglycan LD-endopeptidase CwlK